MRLTTVASRGQGSLLEGGRLFLVQSLDCDWCNSANCIGLSCWPRALGGCGHPRTCSPAPPAPDTEKVLGRVCGVNGRTPEKGASLEDPLRGQESGLAEVCTVAVPWGRAGARSVTDRPAVSSVTPGTLSALSLPIFWGLVGGERRRNPFPVLRIL